jgi:hypothetical protein
MPSSPSQPTHRLRQHDHHNRHHKRHNNNHIITSISFIITVIIPCTADKAHLFLCLQATLGWPGFNPLPNPTGSARAGPGPNSVLEFDEAPADGASPAELKDGKTSPVNVLLVMINSVTNRCLKKLLLMMYLLLKCSVCDCMVRYFWVRKR